MLEALYDGKGSLVLMVLHYEPRDGLPIFAVDIAGFDELVVQFRDRIRRVLGVKVKDDSVDHIIAAQIISRDLFIGVKR